MGSKGEACHSKKPGGVNDCPFPKGGEGENKKGKVFKRQCELKELGEGKKEQTSHYIGEKSWEKSRRKIGS